MKKKVTKKEEVTNQDLGRMMRGLGSGVKGLDLRISKLESYVREGFNSLDNKLEHIDVRLSGQIEGLGRRMDDFADNKISLLTYKGLEHRVLVLESRVLPKAKK